MIDKMLLQWCRRQAASQKLRHEVQITQIAKTGESRPRPANQEPVESVSEQKKRAA